MHRSGVRVVPVCGLCWVGWWTSHRGVRGAQIREPDLQWEDVHWRGGACLTGGEHTWAHLKGGQHLLVSVFLKRSLFLQIGEVLRHLQQPRSVPLQLSSQQPLAHRWCHLLDPEHAQVSQLRLTRSSRRVNGNSLSVTPSSATVWKRRLECEWRGGPSASESCSQTLEGGMTSDSSWRKNSAVRRWRLF